MATLDIDPRRRSEASDDPLLTLLCCGFEAADLATLRERLSAKARAPRTERAVKVEAASEGSVAERVARGDIDLFAIGPRLSGLPAKRLLEEVGRAAPRPPLALIAAGGPDPSLFQDLIDEDRIYYLSLGPVPLDDFAALVEGAVERLIAARGLADGAQAPTPSEEESESLRAERARRALEAAGRMTAARTSEDLAELASEEVRRLLPADRAYLLFYDPAGEVLWSREPGLGGTERRESAAVGLVSFVARTARAVAAPRLAEDPRYEKDADDPVGDGRGPFAAQPVLGPDGRTLAVLAAVRESDQPPFSAVDREMFELFAERALPAFAQIDLESRLAEATKRRERQLRDKALDLFREEALDSNATEGRAHGELLRLSPRWMDWAAWLLMGVVAASFLFLVLGTVHERAQGPAVIRFEQRTEVTATAPGTVTTVVVSPGDRVERGQPLVHFYGADEAAGLERIESEFELRLAERLRDPGDRGAEQALVGLVAERELARTRLAARTLRAPIAGQVADLRVRQGQYVSPGQVVAAVVGAGARPRVAVLLPGRIRPQLETGQRIRLELAGFKYAYQQLTVGQVGQEVVSPEEARRLLGPGLGDAAQIAEPVVFAWAELEQETFTADGRTYRFYDGLWGQGEVRLRSEPILFALVPGLRAITSRGEN